jgi:hypothetical protein
VDKCKSNPTSKFNLVGVIHLVVEQLHATAPDKLIHAFCGMAPCSVFAEELRINKQDKVFGIELGGDSCSESESYGANKALHRTAMPRISPSAFIISADRGM